MTWGPLLSNATYICPYYINTKLYLSQVQTYEVQTSLGSEDCSPQGHFSVNIDLYITLWDPRIRRQSLKFEDPEKVVSVYVIGQTSQRIQTQIHGNI